MAVVESAGPLLVRRYRELYALVDDARDLRTKLYGRTSPLTGQGHGIRQSLQAMRRLHARGPFELQPLISAQAVAKATEDEKQSPLFEVAVDAYWPEALARHAGVQLGLDQPVVRALLRINEAQEASLERVSRWTSPKFWLGVIVAAGAVLANQVPKEAFQYVGWSEYYVGYRSAAFLALVLALIYTVVLIPASINSMGRSSPKHVMAVHELIQLVLVHLEASFESQPATSD
jgi:hypothetical protein